MILSLLSATGITSFDTFLNYLSSHDRVDVTCDHFIEMLEKAVLYHQDFVNTSTVFAVPDEEQILNLLDLVSVLEDMPEGTPEEYQGAVMELGKEYKAGPREWYQLLYSCLIGRPDGPRIGTLMHFLGSEFVIDTLKEKCGC